MVHDSVRRALFKTVSPSVKSTGLEEIEWNDENITNPAYEHKVLARDPYRLKGKFLNNKYRLLGFVGSGGMGAVYVASGSGNKIYAVKILKPDIAIHDEKYLELFENEASAAGKINHPNVIRIFDSGIESEEEQDISYMVMEWFDGETLEEFLMNQRLNISQVANIFKKVCDAVSYAHSQKILHLDIKPLNIMIKTNTDGSFVVKVIDFGMSKIISNESGTTVTKFRGTLKYCSPEHFAGKLTYKSDIYCNAPR